MDDMQEIQEFFIEEASELFENSRNILLKAEQEEQLEADDIDALFRDIHTLKGGSGSVELNKFASYVHHLEDFIDKLRKKTVAPNMKIVDFLIEEIDILQEMLDEESSQTLDDDQLQQQTQTMLEKIAVLDGTKPQEQPKSTEQPQQPKTEIQKNLEKYSGELIDMYDAVTDSLNSVAQSQEFDLTFVNRLFRHLHTLKGSSSFMGFVALPKYLHDVENLLDQARNGHVEYNSEINTMLMETMKTAQEIADDEFNDNIDEEEFAKKLADIENVVNELSHRYRIEDKPEGFVVFEENEEEEKNGGFVLFDEEPKKEEQGFVLFDEVVEEPKKVEEPVGFVLFDEVSKQQDPAVEEKPKEEIKPQKTEVPVKKPKKKNTKSIKKSAASNSIRVGLEKIDFLMNRVGDLVITKSMLYKFLEDLATKIHDPSIVDRLDRLDREIRELQEAVMSVRMIPMESVYAKLPKTIRDLSKKLNKKVNFVHTGDSVEIDKMMVEGLTDPLIHIIRNSLDHGIETPQERIQKGKSETGTLSISATQESGHIIISIKDDGAGINLDKVVQKALDNGVITQKESELMSDEDKAMLIFSAGLSTAEQVSDVSGRGVGMDVVLNNINSLGGSISIKTNKNKGSEFIILLPLTLAILDGLNVIIGKEKLIMPLNMIVESLQPTLDMIKKVGDKQKEILMLRDEFIPIIRLHEFFNIQNSTKDVTKGMLIVTKVANNKTALFVDDFLNQEQIVVKSLEKNFKKIKGIGAATIRGDGSIGLILDVMNIIEEGRE